MNDVKLNEEKFREACSYGDKEALIKLLSQGVDINSKNSMNGWSGLHWACKRGHTDVVNFLLSSGASPNVQNFKCETPAALTSKNEILAMLDSMPQFQPNNQKIAKEKYCDDSEPRTESDFPPNLNPDNETFSSIFLSEMTLNNGTLSKNCSPSPPHKESALTQTSPHHFKKNAQTSTEDENSFNELVLKIRVADINDKDFIEVEIPPSEMSYKSFLSVCSRELGINPQLIERVRKLPNTRLRNNRDIQRLKDFEELEFVVKGLSSQFISVAPSLQSNSTNNAKPVSGFRNHTILY